jgi:dCMP deaminase
MFTEEEKINYLSVAYGYALDSPDPSTQLGAIVVDANKNIIGWGCNTFPRGVSKLTSRLERPIKYSFVEHAERNAIFSCARGGLSTIGATMFAPWFACASCGRAIIQAGIKKVIGHKQRFDLVSDRWDESIAISFTMFEEAGVETELVDTPMTIKPIRADGRLWTP